ncbi:TPA: hypothetical protein RNX31_002122 [Pasteurella multocida]|nr:hypothetical protein [Pasteurella multocida]
MNNQSTSKEYLRLNEISDQIFLNTLAGEACEPFRQKWLKEISNDWANSIYYKMKVKGVAISVRVFLKGNKGAARLFVGDYEDRNRYTKEINFALWKNSYFRDFLNRLEIKDILVHVEKILSDRARDNNAKEQLEFKKNILKRYLLLEEGYKGKGHLYNRRFNQKQKIDIENLQWEEPTLTIRADADFIIKVCAAISQILKAEKVV